MVVTFGSGAGEIPQVTSITAGEIASIMNQSIVGFGGPGLAAFGSTINGELIIKADRFDGTVPEARIGSAVPELGFPTPDTVGGLPGNLIQTVNF